MSDNLAARSQYSRRRGRKLGAGRQRRASSVVQGLLPQFVPTAVELSPILCDPLGGNVMRRWTAPGGLTDRILASPSNSSVSAVIYALRPALAH
jgi:hypothetical protein